MSGLGDIFPEGGVGQQLFTWTVLGSIVGALLDPALTELGYGVNLFAGQKVLSPPDLATAVNRGFTDQSSAATDANKQGYPAAAFATMVDLAGDAPGPSDLAEALRRGIIAADSSINGLPSFTDGIRQGNLRDIWAPMMRQLAVINPTFTDALDAYLEGQLSLADAQHWYALAGGNPDAFQWLFDTRGESPSPQELGTLANRGIIPWDGTGPQVTSFAQGFLEGAWRNKWSDALRALAQYLPPPRTVTAMLKEGTLTEAQAQTLLQKTGLDPDLAAAYVKGATSTASATAKALTEAQVETLLQDKIITAVQATSMLTELGMPAEDAALLVSFVQLKTVIANTASAVSRIKALFISHHLSSVQAGSALAALGLDTAQAAELVAIWTVEKAADVKTLTEAQIGDAVYYGAMSQDDGMASLGALGYQPYDAWVVLSVSAKAALPNPPPRTLDPS